MLLVIIVYIRRIFRMLETFSEMLYLHDGIDGDNDDRVVKVALDVSSPLMVKLNIF